MEYAKGARKWVKLYNYDENNDEKTELIKSIIYPDLYPRRHFYARLYFAKKGGIRLQVSQDFFGFYSINILRDKFEKLIDVIPELLEFDPEQQNKPII